jgi:hypothetical protein
MALSWMFREYRTCLKDDKRRLDPSPTISGKPAGGIIFPGHNLPVLWKVVR